MNTSSPLFTLVTSTFIENLPDVPLISMADKLKYGVSCYISDIRVCFYS
jgi:hypothetical protein